MISCHRVRRDARSGHLRLLFVLFAAQLGLTTGFVVAARENPGDRSPVERCLTVEHDTSRTVIVITDVEPDDRYALHVLAHNLDDGELVVAGATLLNAPLKTALLRRLLVQLGKPEVAVVQGIGGYDEDYPPTRSSRAARSFPHEGIGILGSAELDDLQEEPRVSMELRAAIIETLSTSSEVDIVLLAPGADLAAALREQPALAKSIRCVHMMGGWLERDEGLRATYNWNMAPEATAYLLSRRDVPIVLYSSHALRRSFESISVNRETFPALWRRLAARALDSRGLFETLVASATWDNHIIDTYPPIREPLGDHAGRNFSPSDPTTAIGAVDPRIINGFELMTVELEVSDRVEAAGFVVRAAADDEGHVAVVDRVDVEVFRERMIEAIDAAATYEMSDVVGDRKQ